MNPMQRRQQVSQAACCLLCMFLISRWLDEPGELIGGWLTGPLFHMADAGWVLFALAFLLTFVYRRVAASIGLIACALCTPLSIYIAAPGHLRWLFRSELLASDTAVWSLSRSVNLLALIVTTYVCVRGVSAGHRPKTDLLSQTS
jgi:hypothetical protein